MFLGNQRNKAESSVATTLQSIRQNPKFARLLGFSLTHLAELCKPTNPKHRENSSFVIDDQGYIPLVKALSDHAENDSIITVLVFFNSFKLFVDFMCMFNTYHRI